MTFQPSIPDKLYR